MMARLQNRVAIVTGGASGMGAATVRRFTAEGARVVIADIDKAAGTALAGELADTTIFVPCDHTDSAACEATVDAAVERFGKIDILFNNAGIPFANDTITNVSDETLERIVDVDLIGPYRMTRAAVPALKQAARSLPGGAAILYTSSLQGVVARPFVTPYTAAKHGIVGLTRGLALELAKDNIRVNVLCPVATETPMLPKFMPESASADAEKLAAMRDILKKGIPLRRIAEADDIANAALFLASDEASMITGVALPIDGGITAG